MSRRETAIHYVLEHRTALLLAGFVLLVDQLLVDWGLMLSADGARGFGPFGMVEAGRGTATSLALALLLLVAGGFGLWRRARRMRALELSRTSGGPSPRRRVWPASELLVLVGALAIAVNLALRGVPSTPLTLEPLGWALEPATLVALPAAVVLLAETWLPRAVGTPRRLAAGR